MQQKSEKRVPEFFKFCIKIFPLEGCLRPYHLECTSSRPITEVKQGRGVLVLGWVTAWEKTAATTTPHSTQPHRHSDGPQGQTGLFVNQLPDGSQKEIVSHSLDAPQTRKSLVKGERFKRFVSQVGLALQYRQDRLTSPLNLKILRMIKGGTPFLSSD